MYQPSPIPLEGDLRIYVQDELQRIAACLTALNDGHIDVTNVAPAKPRKGDIRYADGTNWKPNGAGGTGIWFYNGTAWVQMG